MRVFPKLNSLHRFSLIALAAVLTFGCATSERDSSADTVADKEIVMESLPGTSWKVTRIPGASADAAESRLNVEADGSINGTTGCNNYQGPAEIEGASIRVGLLATTRKMCPEPVSDQEQAFLDALGAAWSWTRLGSTLQLRDETGALVMELVEAEE
jgi:heat shock protein HslJ